MDRPKITVCVYTIALNEERFALRWAKSTEDADYRVVGDTGSTDDTVTILRNEGVIVHNIVIKPWRFDKSRNLVIELAPKDVTWFVSLDMDEVLFRGWRQALEKTVRVDPRLTFINCQFASYFPSKPQITEHWHERIHIRGYKWTNAVHEKPIYQLPPPPKVGWCRELRMEQHPNESKDRTSYLKLLEYTVLVDSQQRHKYSPPVIPISATDPTLIRLNPDWWKLWYFLAEERFRSNESQNLVGAIFAGWYSQSISGAWERCRDEVVKFYVRPALIKIMQRDVYSWLQVCYQEYPWLLRYPEGLISVGIDISYISEELEEKSKSIEESKLQEITQTIFTELKKAEKLDNLQLCEVIGKTTQFSLIKM